MAASRIAAFIDTWNEQGLEAAAERGWDPEIVWTEPPDWPGRRTIHGREAMVAHMKERLEMLGWVRLEFVSETSVAEDIALGEIIARGHGGSSGVPTAARQYLVIERGADAARRVHEFMSREPAEAKAAELARCRR